MAKNVQLSFFGLQFLIPRIHSEGRKKKSRVEEIERKQCQKRQKKIYKQAKKKDWGVEAAVVKKFLCISLFFYRGIKAKVWGT